MNAGVDGSMLDTRSPIPGSVWYRLPIALLILGVASAVIVAVLVPAEYRSLVLLAPVVVVFGLVFLVRPDLALVLTIVITPLETSVVFDTVFPPELSLSKTLGFLLLGAFLFNILFRGMRFRFLDDKQDYVVLLFCAAILFSAVTSAYPNAVVNEIDRVFRLVALYFAVKNLVRTERTIQLLLVGLFLTSLFATGHSILQYQMDSAGRASGIDDNPNNFALASVVAFSIGVYLFVASRQPLVKVFYAAGVVAVVTGIVLSGSRGGLLSLGLVVALMVLRHPKRIQIGMAAVLAMAVALPLLPADVTSRWLASGTGFQDSAEESATNSVARRFGYVDLGLEIIAEHPVLGAGYRSFRQIYPQSDYALLDNPLTQREISRVAHNVYLETFTGTGLIGLFAFMAMLFVGWSSFRTAGKMLEPRTIAWSAALGLEYALIGFAISSIFISSEQQKSVWFLLGMSSALLFFARTHARSMPALDQPAHYASEESARVS
jgi:O-antigen ligase